MRLNIHGKNMEVTPALHAYAEGKLGRLKDWLHETADMQIMLSVQGHKHEHVVEITVHEEGIVLRAEEKQADMYASIDLAADKLERRIRKWREKLRDRRHSATRAAGRQPASHDEAHDEEGLEIVRHKEILLKPVDVEEALLQMKLLDHDFHLFVNRESGRTELVYKRRDGSFGHLTTA